MRALLLLPLLACVPGASLRPRPALVFDDSAAPVEYRAPVKAGSREVRGEACRETLGLPLFLYGGFDAVGWGQEGYRDAVERAQAQAPGQTLTDVSADIHFTNVLIWREECVVVTAAAE